MTTRAFTGTNPENAANCINMVTHDRGICLRYLREADTLLKVLKHGASAYGSGRGIR